MTACFECEKPLSFDGGFFLLVRPMTRLWTGVLGLALMALLGAEVVALTGSWLWQGDMITPFRLQMLAAGAGLGLLTIPLRRRALYGLVILVLCTNLVPMAPRLLERHSLPAHAKGHAISVVFANVLCDNRQFNRIPAMVRTEMPDVFVASETTPEWMAHLDGLKDRYPYRFYAGPGIFGIAAYARRPFTAQVFRIGRHQMPLGRLEFDNLVVLIAHPQPPARLGLAAENQAYLRALANLAQTAAKPVVVAGDLNATLWSHSLKPLIQADLQWPAGSGMAYSWPVGKPQMAIQIDHILTTHAVAGHYRVLPPDGSDHFPVRADLVF
jgi:endonuclease/exonuclease/phosphatase (EEP) superfamily protein YafD